MDKSIIRLKSIGLKNIADIVENIVSHNPYSEKYLQHYLWNEFAEKNIPFLIVLSNFINDQSKYKNITNILFTTRDCVFLKQLFNKLYPNQKTETFYASRALYLFPTTNYIEYCKKNLTPDSIIIDFQGTGQSFKTLVSGLNLEPWYMLVNWNSVSKLDYSNAYLHDYNKKIIIREKNFFDDAVEKLNIDLIGTYFDYYDNKPISYKYEYNQNIIVALHECFNYFIDYINNKEYSLRQYVWTKEFNDWMDNYYTTSTITNRIQWIHTHFVYEKNNIDKIRNEYRNAQTC